MNDLTISSLTPSQPKDLYPPSRVKGGAHRPQANFVDLLKDFLNDVNRLQIRADGSIEKLATGQIADVHQVMVAVEEANIALQLILEIRNKLLEGYQELMKMPV